jgi:hypothetical protein
MNILKISGWKKLIFRIMGGKTTAKDIDIYFSHKSLLKKNWYRPVKKIIIKYLCVDKTTKLQM